MAESTLSHEHDVGDEDVTADAAAAAAAGPKPLEFFTALSDKDSGLLHRLARRAAAGLQVRHVMPQWLGMALKESIPRLLSMAVDLTELVADGIGASRREGGV